MVQISAYELALAKVLGEEEVAFRGLDKVGLEATALKMDANVCDGEMVLDKLRPATGSRLDMILGAEAAPADAQMKSEVVYDRLAAVVGRVGNGNVDITDRADSSAIALVARHGDSFHVKPLRLAAPKRRTFLLIDCPGLFIFASLFCGGLVLDPGA